MDFPLELNGNGALQEEVISFKAWDRLFNMLLG